MDTTLGGVYFLELQLHNAAGVSSSWLIGALVATYPQVDLISINYYTSQLALVEVGWNRRPTGKIEVGDKVAVTLQGLEVASSVFPFGTVKNVVHKETVNITPPKKVDNALKLAGAFALLAIVHFFSVKASENVITRS